MNAEQEVFPDAKSYNPRNMTLTQGKGISVDYHGSNMSIQMWNVPKL